MVLPRRLHTLATRDRETSCDRPTLFLCLLWQRHRHRHTQRVRERKRREKEKREEREEKRKRREKEKNEREKRREKGLNRNTAGERGDTLESRAAIKAA